MQQATDDAGHIHLQVGNDTCHRHRMNQIGLSRQPFLPLMHFGRKIISFADQVDIRGRIIGLNLIHQIGDFNFLAHGRGYLVADATARCAIA